MLRSSISCVLLILFACGGETPPARPVGASAPATTPSSPLAAPAPRHTETTCETPADCAALVNVCPRAHPHNAGNCMRPYAPTGEHLLGVCSDAHCEVDDEAECNAAAARCVGAGTGTFQAYDPPDPDYRRGGCTVRCAAYPDPQQGAR